MANIDIKTWRATILPAHFLIGVGLALIMWGFNHSFYFHDDMQHQFLPAYYHIGAMLRSGQPPVLSLQSFYGGNLLGEHQYGVFNPVNLALFALLPSIDDFRNAGLVLACFHYGVLVSGAFALARGFGIRPPWASVAATAIGCNSFLAYWFASTWFPAFISVAWFLWAWAYLIRADKGRLEWLLCVVFCYLTIASGYPQTTIALCLVTIIPVFVKWRQATLGRLSAAPIALACAVLFNAIPLAALLVLNKLSGRPQGLFNNNFLVPNLHDVLAFASPFHFGFIKGFGGYSHTLTPLFYAGWFLIPCLPLINWSSQRRPRIAFSSLIAAGCLFLMLSQGPEYQHFVRFPFRWLPFFQVTIVLLFCIAASRLGFLLSAKRMWLSAFLVALIFAWSYQVTPERWAPLLWGQVLALLGILTFAAVKFHKEIARPLIVSVISTALFVGTHFLIPSNSYVGDLALSPSSAKGRDHVDMTSPLAYSMYLGPRYSSPEVQTGLLQLGFDHPILYGASGIENLAMAKALCMESYGQTCLEGTGRLFERDQKTGVPLIDLFRIDRITVMKGAYLDTLKPYLTTDWKLEYDGAVTQRYTRQLTRPLPGTLAWIANGVRVDLMRASNLAEVTQVQNATDSEALVIYTRLWWPGYRAYLDGVEVPVIAHRGIFVAVNLPPRAAGTLELRYRPPFFKMAIFAAFFALALMVLLLFFFRSWMALDLGWPLRSRSWHSQA